MNRTINLVVLTALLTMPLPACMGAVFDEQTAYSKQVISSRLHDFYANKSHMGLATFDANGLQTAEAQNMKLDYVPGLVAKAVLEAADYYCATDEANARAWYYSIEHYANSFYNNVPTGGGSLDDLNATKIYAQLYELSQGSFSTIADKQTAAHCVQALNKAAQGLKAHDDTYSIQASTFSEAAGGWFHKSGYPNQMWLDGQYMGPALLAQILTLNARHQGGDVVAVALTDGWKKIVKQFDITWQYLWNEQTGLLYHAFSATPTASSSKAAWGQVGVYHSAEYWGRAEGWYFFALVDVLEFMQLSGLSHGDDYQRLRGYLNKMAAGLAAKQDAATGCWYQLLNHDGSFYADNYKNRSYQPVYNYLESSASAIFIACYLKGQRLGLFDTDYTAMARKAYKGFVEQFLVDDGQGGMHISGSCRSAGLCGSNNRDGSAAYYLLGPDVTVVTPAMKQTEGKVLGAFILAALEYERLGALTALKPSHSAACNKQETIKYMKDRNVYIQSSTGVYKL